jgi:Ca2+-binding EF-hand superfamily protein
LIFTLHFNGAAHPFLYLRFGAEERATITILEIIIMVNITDQSLGSIEPIHFVSPTRKFWSFKPERGDLDQSKLVTLEDFRDSLKTLTAKQQPEDYVLSLSQLAANFSGGVGRIMPLVADKYGNRIQRDPLYVDTTGWGHLAQMMLPRSGGSFLRDLVALQPNNRLNDQQSAQMSEKHCQLAAATFMMFAAANDQMVKIRTVLKDIGGGHTARFIRAVVSDSYADYSNLDLVNEVLDTLGNYHVYRHDIADSGMYLRLMDLNDHDGVVTTNTLIPTLNVWNSETKQRRAGGGSGTVRLTCTNGQGEYEKHGQFNFVHRGSSSAMAANMRQAMESIRTQQSTLMSEYQQAISIAIDDGFAFMNDMLSSINGFSKATVDRVGHAMEDPTSNDSNTLAGVVDGMTLLAQSPDIDLWDSIALEEHATRVMRKGLRQARDGRIRNRREPVLA